MFSWTVTNIGSVTAPADWQDRVYISDDDVFDSFDQFVVSQFINSQTPLVAGASYTVTKSVTIPNTDPG